MAAEAEPATKGSAPSAPHGIAILGARASGKTTLIGLLVHLVRSQRSKEFDWINSVDKQVEDYVGRLAADVEFGRFERIAATESGARWRVELELGRKGQTKPDLTLLINDVSGENIEAFLKGETDDLSLQLASDLQSAAGVIVLVDPELLYEERRRAGGDDDGLLYLLREAVRKILDSSKASVWVLFPRCTTQASEGGRIALIRSGQFIEANPSEVDHGVQSIARELGKAFASVLPWLQPSHRLGYGAYDARDPKTYSSLISHFDLLCHEAKGSEKRRRRVARLRAAAIPALAVCGVLLLCGVALAMGFVPGTAPAHKRVASRAVQELQKVKDETAQALEQKDQQLDLERERLERERIERERLERERKQEEERERKQEEEEKRKQEEEEKRNREYLSEANREIDDGNKCFKEGKDGWRAWYYDRALHNQAVVHYRSAERALGDIRRDVGDATFGEEVAQARQKLNEAKKLFEEAWGPDAWQRQSVE